MNPEEKVCAICGATPAAEVTVGSDKDQSRWITKLLCGKHFAPRPHVTTPEQFADQMQKISDEHGSDREFAHSLMDGIISRVLIELGYEAGAKIFDE